jgi:uncharacterized DUF497 family protein
MGVAEVLGAGEARRLGAPVCIDVCIGKCLHKATTPWPVSFDWDEGNREKCRKHGVSIDEIETFLRTTPRTAPDQKHSGAEQRFIAVGRNMQGRAMFVAFAIREKDGELYLRPISARYMHQEEIENYEKEGS